DHAVRAIAALRGLLVDEGLLQRMRLLDRAEPLERRHLALPDLGNRRNAGARCNSVQEHRAGAALRKPATEFRTVELEIVAEHVEQGRVGLGIDRARRPIDLQADGHACRLLEGAAIAALAFLEWFYFASGRAAASRAPPWFFTVAGGRLAPNRPWLAGKI